MKIRYEIHDIRKVFAFWAERYEMPDGFKLIKYETFFDPMQGQVVFKLILDKEESE